MKIYWLTHVETGIFLDEGQYWIDDKESPRSLLGDHPDYEVTEYIPVKASMVDEMVQALLLVTKLKDI